MPAYVVLMNWTEQGVGNAKESVNRYRTARSAWEGRGIRFQSIHWTQGQHDIVCVLEAPDDETLAAALLGLAGAGNLRTTTMRAFSEQEMEQIAQLIG